MSGNPVAAARAALARCDAEDRPGIWIERLPAGRVLAAAEDVARRVAAGAHLPLAGTTLAVKGNIDVAGLRTTAGCPAYGSVATRSAAAVRALVDAGAVVIGTTNLDQFATGLVGTRSPYGVCPNAHWDGLISGGSSSGSAVAVAAGLVDLALGTDTAGSGRVPAAANGIVGIKPTRGRISAAGVVPACASLDCVSVFAADVPSAALATSVAACGGPDADDPWHRPRPAAPVPDRPVRLGLGLTGDPAADFDGDASGPARFAAAVDRFVAAAATRVAGPATRVDASGLVAAGSLLYDGAFVAERYAAVGAFVDAHLNEVDPVVGPIISAAGRLPAWRLAADRTTLAGLARATAAIWDDVDVLVVPTVPRLPTVAEVLAEPLAVNTMLGRFTNFVNLLDLCALTLPVRTPLDGDGPPMSLTLIAPADHDDVLTALPPALPQAEL